MPRVYCSECILCHCVSKYTKKRNTAQCLMGIVLSLFLKSIELVFIDNLLRLEWEFVWSFNRSLCPGNYSWIWACHRVAAVWLMFCVEISKQNDKFQLQRSTLAFMIKPLDSRWHAHAMVYWFVFSLHNNPFSWFHKRTHWDNDIQK